MKLAITGGMASGKTSIAKYLVENYNFTKFSFADDLKLYAAEIFDMKIKDRKLLQEFGEGYDKEVIHRDDLVLIDEQVSKN